jgi:hypothetical protein
MQSGNDIMHDIEYEHEPAEEPSPIGQLKAKSETESQLLTAPEGFNRR